MVEVEALQMVKAEALHMVQSEALQMVEAEALLKKALPPLFLVSPSVDLPSSFKINILEFSWAKLAILFPIQDIFLPEEEEISKIDVSFRPVVEFKDHTEEELDIPQVSTVLQA